VPRKLSGVLILDKPLGLTSNRALQKTKRLFEAAKAGHTGSLDPLATGLLPICFGEATKFSQFMLDADKVYAVTGQLGVVTTTGDAEGAILREAPVPTVTESDIQTYLQPFLGPIFQVPPMYSALKQQGRPLYELARAGIEVTRPARPVTIFSITIKAIDLPSISLEVHCSKGTYIRSLIEDIGNAIGCGAFVSELRRLRHGPFQASQMQTLEALEAADLLNAPEHYLLPSESLLVGLPQIEISVSEAFALQQGKVVMISNEIALGTLAVYCEKQLMGLGKVVTPGVLQAQRLMSSAGE
jgi:tRNA pseudouridine55 synthase